MLTYIFSKKSYNIRITPK